jgi:sulfur-oxidizing protein SoxZ
VARTRISIPASARRGEIVEIRALIAHPMESGYRSGPDGKMLPRDILRRFSCRYGGELVFSADLYPAIAANPFIAFQILAGDSGPLQFTWEGDNGFSQTETQPITVT